jgi:cytochrome c
MRHRLIAAAPLAGLLLLGACQERPFPPNVQPPRAAEPATPRPPQPQPPRPKPAPARFIRGEAALSMAGSPADANPIPPAEAGLRFAKAHCSACHAIGDTGASPNPRSPPFRQIVKRYPPENLAEAFNEGIVVGHGKMPPFVMSPEQADDVIAYLKTLAP